MPLPVLPSTAVCCWMIISGSFTSHPFERVGRARSLALLSWTSFATLAGRDEGLIRFCAPQQALRMMARVSVERAWEFQLAGAGLLVLAGLLGYGVYAR